MSARAARRLNVFLYGKHIAVLSRTTTGYQVAFTSDGMSSAPLSLALMNDSAKHTDTFPGGRVSTWLYNLLPDDATVRGTLAKEMGVEPDAMSMLSVMGVDCAGAVQFAPEGVSINRPRTLEPMSDGDIAAALRSSRLLKHGQPRPDGDRMRGRFSLAGFQTKFTLRRKGEEWFLPDGDEPSTHIIKPSIKHNDIAHQAFVEHITMRTAQRLNLNVAKTEYREFDGEECLIVERYDRTVVGGELERIHQEDAGSALSVDPDHKYDITARQIREVIDRSSSPDEDKRRAFASLAFNALAGGADAHAKNLSMLIAPSGRVRLAPLYDIASAFPYAADDTLALVSDRIAIKVGSTTSFSSITAKDWDGLAADMGIDTIEARGIVTDLARRLPSALDDALHETNTPDRLRQWALESPWTALTSSAAGNAIAAFE